MTVKCPICGKEFKDGKALGGHIIHHKSTPAPGPQTTQSMTQPGPAPNPQTIQPLQPGPTPYYYQELQQSQQQSQRQQQSQPFTLADIITALAALRGQSGGGTLEKMLIQKAVDSLLQDIELSQRVKQELLLGPTRTLAKEIGKTRAKQLLTSESGEETEESGISDLIRNILERISKLEQALSKPQESKPSEKKEQGEIK